MSNFTPSPQLRDCLAETLEQYVTLGTTEELQGVHVMVRHLMATINDEIKASLPSYTKAGLTRYRVTEEGLRALEEAGGR